MKKILAALALLTAGGFLSAQTPLEPIVERIRTQALSLPAETSIVSLTPADKENPRQTYTIRRTFAADGSFTVEWKSSKFQSSQRFRPDGTLSSGQQTDLVKRISVTSESDAARTTLRTIITEKGAEKSNKKVALKPAIVLREELQHLNLQAWEAGIRDGLKLQSLSPDGGMVGDFQIVFRSTNDPTKLSDKYSYPAEFKAALAGSTNYLVADMSLQGVGAFFFPHHFYVVYAVTGSILEFRGYFGEDPKNPTFQFVPRS